MEWIISSNFPMKGNEAIAKFILHKLGPLPYLYIGYSISADKYRKRMDDYEFPPGHFLDLSKEKELPDLGQYGLLVFHGGIPEKVKKTLKKSRILPQLDLFRGIGVSVSGSSCAFSKGYSLIRKFYPCWSNETSGLGIFPFEVLPHSGRYKKHRDEIDLYGETRDLLVIEDGQGYYYNGKEPQLIE